MSAFSASLRFKLTAWFLLIFAVVFSGVLAAASLLHFRATRRLLDERLLTLAEGVSELLIDAVETDVRDGLYPFQPPDRAFVLLAVRDETGRVLAARWRVDPAALPPVPATARAGEPAIVSLTSDLAARLLNDKQGARLVTYPFSAPGGAIRYLDLAATTDLYREQDAFLVDVLLVGGLGAFVASALAAWLVAGRAVQPMRQLADAAKSVSPSQISNRIEVNDSEVEVQNLRTALNDALTRLEEGYRAQDRFISNVAHDLKTPIAVMLTQSQVLRPGSVSEEEFEHYRISVMAEMQRLGKLVESFLTLARADQGDALARVVNVHMIDVMMEAISECDALAEQAHVRLVATIDATASGEEDFGLRGDPDLLRTTLVNLISNAVRYSPSGEAIDIRVARENDCAVYSVRDRGPGIPENCQQSIFDRFVQLQSHEPRAGGTGLGLAIAKTIAERHGGTIDVHNCPSRGCVFSLRLPLPKPLGADSNRPAPAFDGARR